MRNPEDKAHLDHQSREMILGALYDGFNAQDISEEELASIAEDGLLNIDEERQDHILYALTHNTNGAMGAIDVFRLIQSEKKEQASSDESSVKESYDSIQNQSLGSSNIDPIHVNSQSEQGQGSQSQRRSIRIEGTSGMLGVLWAMAACVVLFVGVWMPNVNNQQPIRQSISIENTPQIDPPRSGLVNPENDVESSDHHPDDVGVAVADKQRDAQEYLMITSLVLLVVLPPMIMVIRKKS